LYFYLCQIFINVGGLSNEEIVPKTKRETREKNREEIELRKIRKIDGVVRKIRERLRVVEERKF